jgi:hypothetical protein
VLSLAEELEVRNRGEEELRRQLAAAVQAAEDEAHRCAGLCADIRRRLNLWMVMAVPLFGGEDPLLLYCVRSVAMNNCRRVEEGYKEASHAVTKAL